MKATGIGPRGPGTIGGQPGGLVLPVPGPVAGELPVLRYAQLLSDGDVGGGHQQRGTGRQTGIGQWSRGQRGGCGCSRCRCGRRQGSDGVGGRGRIDRRGRGWQGGGWGADDAECERGGRDQPHEVSVCVRVREPAATGRRCFVILLVGLVMFFLG